MPVLKIPTFLRYYVNGQQEVLVTGETIAEAMEDFLTQFPVLRPHLTNSKGEFRSFVNLFVGENNIRDLQGLATPINEGDQIILVPSIAGG
jgi:molybdopterin synthase sulfur carrier subunit